MERAAHLRDLRNFLSEPVYFGFAWILLVFCFLREIVIRIFKRYYIAVSSDWTFEFLNVPIILLGDRGSGCEHLLTPDQLHIFYGALFWDR